MPEPELLQGCSGEPFDSRRVADIGEQFPGEVERAELARVGDQLGHAVDRVGVDAHPFVRSRRRGRARAQQGRRADGGHHLGRSRVAPSRCFDRVVAGQQPGDRGAAEGVAGPGRVDGDGPLTGDVGAVVAL